MTHMDWRELYLLQRRMADLLATDRFDWWTQYRWSAGFLGVY